ncbi:MAG: tRNA lysidine(34) synthetase TilS [Nitrosomonadales bacterium]|nr:tRNA lysidine(34) synthetase TilS [Nitrosomonadales bacterium]
MVSSRKPNSDPLRPLTAEGSLRTGGAPAGAPLAGKSGGAGDLRSRVAGALSNAVPAGSSIVLGLSGGVDSVVLLHLLHRLSLTHSWRLRALHVHHGISPNADAWAAFCADLCARCGVPLQIERVDIAPLRGHGIEAAARKLRHEIFCRQRADFAAFAHHRDDQAETLLLQLLRGAGVRGAAAMPFIRPRAGAPTLLRPLLDVTRGELIEHARRHDLQWVEDESNADDLYPRNFLRRRVLPLLEQRFPSYRETLARSARHFAEAGDLLDQLAQLDAQLSPSPLAVTRDWAAVSGQPSRMAGSSIGEVWGESVLEIARLQSLSQPRAKNALRYFLHVLGAPMPQAVQLDEMLRQVCGAREDGMVRVEFGGWEVRRYRGQVYAMPAPGEIPSGLSIAWNGEAELEWPALGATIYFSSAAGEGISPERLSAAPVTLRLRAGGETLRPNRTAATRSLKKLLQQHRVPPWRRERLPLLYCGGALASVVGVAVAAEYQARQGEMGVVVRYRFAR